MRFQLFSALALIASVSAVDVTSQQEVRDVANQAGPAGVARSFQHNHATPRRRRRYRKRKTTCKTPKAKGNSTTGSPQAGEQPGDVFAQVEAPASSSAVASATQSEAAAAPSAAGSDADNAEQIYEEALASSASSGGDTTATAAAEVDTKEKAQTKQKVNTSVKEAAEGVDKWTGTLAPDQSSLGSALQSFSTGGGGVGNSFLNMGSSVKYGSFADMTNEGYNAGLKDGYGKLRVDGNSWTFTYEQGQVNDKDSWFWYTTADPGNSGMDLTKARTASFTYTVKFQEGFDWKLGGKLPGWYGGDSAEQAKHCSGHAGGPGCFSSRLMWRPDGVGEIYNYYWGSKQAYCTDPGSYAVGTGQIICHGGSGDSLGRGSFKFEAGKPVTVTNTITLNTMNGDTPNPDGKQSLVVDGVKVIEANNLVMRHHEEGRIRGLFFSTFFGGSGGSWASPKKQEATFSDISVSVLENL